MPEAAPSEFNQSSFLGGMSLLGDDTTLLPTQYRAGFDITNRYGELQLLLQSVEDTAIPDGVIQELVTFGDYLILFVGGYAYYRLYSSIGWKIIREFKMSSIAPRFWTCAIPVSTTNYIRIAATGSTNVGTSNPAAAIQLANVEGASAGNLAGLLVQDNINQPSFIFLDESDNPTSRITQTFIQWAITFTDATNVTVATDSNGNTEDYREYVPIGNCMTWAGGILFITSKDFTTIYRSVSGRPLDFVINVTNILAANTIPDTWIYTDPISGNDFTVSVPPYTQSSGGAFTAGNVYNPGGDATTTSYSVGVSGISCIRPLSTGGIFVSGSDANFAVTLNQTPNAPTIFGEYTFNRAFLFNGSCLNDRAIIDSIGDTRFVDLRGIRSFNAIQQLQNEGQNSVFSSSIQAAFGDLGDSANPEIVQDPTQAAAILFNNYEIYAVNTIFGSALAKYDTVNNCWVAFDLLQIANKPVKILAKIELTTSQLFAVTTDNSLYTLYAGEDYNPGLVRTIGVSAGLLYANYDISLKHPKSEIKPINIRVINNKVQSSGTMTLTPYINNRLSLTGSIKKTISYSPPTDVSSNVTDLPDVNTQLSNLYFNLTGREQGWKMFAMIQWNTGVISQYSFELENLNPQNPNRTQAQVT